jgi:Tfp pilus assembly protein FimT
MHQPHPRDSSHSIVKGITVEYMGTGSESVRRRHSQRGYTLIEFLVTAMILMTVAAISAYKLLPAWQQTQSSAGMSEVKSALRQARETAISQRRTIVVQFVAAGANVQCPNGSGSLNCIELFQVSVSGSPPVSVTATTPYLTVPLTHNVQFLTFSGETDTPDAFGIPTAPAGTYFPSAVGNMQFQSDGTFTDSVGTPRSGTVFLGVSNTPSSATAVTIMGSTGRVRSYRGNGQTPTTGWSQ